MQIIAQSKLNTLGWRVNMNTTSRIAEGFVSFRGYNVWYRIVGDGEAENRLPLLCLHGGPGASHDYLEPLEAIAATGRRVIFYDQLGGGQLGPAA
jgi:pimeloyl-ACP methyl ester carboxylesterase